MYLLDFGTCLQFLDGGNGAIAARLRAERPSNVGLSSMVKADLLSLARRGTDVEPKLDALQRFFEPLSIVPFDDRCAEEYGQIHAQLPGQEPSMSTRDLVSAATARAHDAVLVTLRVARFNAIAGLRLVDWRD